MIKKLIIYMYYILRNVCRNIFEGVIKRMGNEATCDCITYITLISYYKDVIYCCAIGP